MQFSKLFSAVFSVRTLAVILLAASLTACGFHLRGNIPLPAGIQNMFMDAPEGTFKEVLTEVLTNAGGQLNSVAEGADVILSITNAATNRSVGTLDERGKADSYNLRFKVSYVLSSPEQETIRKASLVETRRYNFNPEQVLESESEEEELQSDMEEAIALRMVRQLSSMTDYKAK